MRKYNTIICNVQIVMKVLFLVLALCIQLVYSCCYSVQVQRKVCSTIYANNLAVIELYANVSKPPLLGPKVGVTYEITDLANPYEIEVNNVVISSPCSNSVVNLTFNVTHTGTYMLNISIDGINTNKSKDVVYVTVTYKGEAIYESATEYNNRIASNNTLSQPIDVITCCIAGCLLDNLYDEIGVTFIFTYTDCDGKRHPLQNVTFLAMERDTNPFTDENLGMYTVDATGRAGVLLHPPFEFGSQEIYVIITLANDIVTMVKGTPSSYSTYTYNGRDAYIAIPDGSVVNFPFNWGAMCEPIFVYNNYTNITYWAKNNLKYISTITIPPMRLLYPGPSATDAYFLSPSGNGVYPYSNTLIVLGSSYYYGTVLAHEFGHWLYYILYEGYSPSPGGAHYYCEDFNRNVFTVPPSLALMEGIATVLSMIINDYNGFIRATPKFQSQRIEYYSCDTTDLATDEFRLVAGLWDMYDSQKDCSQYYTYGRNDTCDDNVGYTLSAEDILIAPFLQKPNNISDYWIYLSDYLLGYGDEIKLHQCYLSMYHNWFNGIDTSL